jgi:RNA polymerase-binding transcription factor DksA
MVEAERQKLEAERTRTQAEIKRLSGYLETEVDRFIDGGEDSVDAASDVYEREKTLAIIQMLEKKLASLDRALAVAARGRYGYCEMCGEAIDPERLAIVPQTTTCVKCQVKLERGSRRRPRLALPLDEE